MFLITEILIVYYHYTKNVRILVQLQTSEVQKLCIMRPSSLGGGRILRRTLSVCLSVRPSRASRSEASLGAT